MKMEQNPVALGKHIVRTSLYHFVRRSLYHFGYDVIRNGLRNMEEKDFEVRLKKQNYGFDETTIKIYEQVSPVTLTNIERVFALKNAIEYIIKNDIPGDIVECGVWRGGSMMAAALTLLNLGAKRRLYLFDTFAGMTAPTSVDRDLFGKSATESSEGSAPSDPSKDAPPLWEVKANLRSTGYDENLITYVQGPVEETLPANAPATIAILRLDTDWYESTRHEMQHLYPRLSSGGVLIIDDYGHYEGARLAVDEFIAAGGLPLLLHRIDYTARICVKPRSHVKPILTPSKRSDKEARRFPGDH